MGHKDLRLGQIVYILVFCNMSFSRLLPLDGFQFIFLLRDSENDLLFKVKSNVEPFVVHFPCHFRHLIFVFLDGYSGKLLFYYKFELSSP